MELRGSRDEQVNCPHGLPTAQHLRADPGRFPGDLSVNLQDVERADALQGLPKGPSGSDVT